MVLVLMNKNIVLKSLFRVKRHGFEDEQAKLVCGDVNG